MNTSVVVPGDLPRLLQLTRDFAAHINQLHGDSADSPTIRVAAFHMAHNHVAMAMELLSFYYSQWAAGAQGVPISDLFQTHQIRSVSRPAGQVRQENGERVMEVLKRLFIASMSSVEFSAKENLRVVGTQMVAQWLSNNRRGRRIYLSDIMTGSRECGVIGADVWQRWKDLIFFRNVVVHNNGVSDKDMDFACDGKTILVRTDKMITGSLDFFAVLTRMLLEQHRDWIVATNV